MKKSIPLILFIFCAFQSSAQNFTGQWKGEFLDKSTSFAGWAGDRCEYVLEIDCKGTDVTGYSYTYFTFEGKRFYTICKLRGKLNNKSKSIEVTETERTKTNVPKEIRNCFQIHRLTYFQKGEDLSLEGSWVPAPNQEGDCGFGTTVLSRRLLQKNAAYINKPVTKSTPAVKSKTTAPTPPLVKNTPKQTTPPVTKIQPKKVPPPVVKKDTKKTVDHPVVKNDPEKKKITSTKEAVAEDLPSRPALQTEPVTIKSPNGIYTKRSNELLKTIEIDNASFTVDLYDNGEIDGDSISLFFNGDLILSHKRLSDKALRLKLEVDKDKELNELIMYAENLGTIPPNTALMVVNDGDNRYEVRISSDLQKSGAIRFKYRSKIKQ